MTIQDRSGIYEEALDQLRRGLKTSHWMWFVFPQLAGLGESAMAQRFAISSRDEARAYLAHPVLGPRLVACVEVLTDLRDRTAEQIFGEIDTVKLRSSLTLFMRATPENPVFARALERYFEGSPDPVTDELLEADRSKDGA